MFFAKSTELLPTIDQKHSYNHIILVNDMSLNRSHRNWHIIQQLRSNTEGKYSMTFMKKDPLYKKHLNSNPWNEKLLESRLERKSNEEIIFCNVVAVALKAGFYLKIAYILY